MTLETTLTNLLFAIINAVMHQKLVQRGNTITDGANVAITQMGERYSMYLVLVLVSTYYWTIVLIPQVCNSDCSQSGEESL